MEEKEYLNEEKYQKTKSKLKIIALCILIIGVLIGVSIIVVGAKKTESLKDENERIVSQKQKDIDEVKKKMDEVDREMNLLQIEKNKIFRDDSGFSDRYYEKELELDAKRKEHSELNDQLNDLNLSREKDVWQYRTLYAVGGMIIFASCIISVGIYIKSKRREIMAFHAQEIMPVAQEGMEKMAPT